MPFSGVRRPTKRIFVASHDIPNRLVVFFAVGLNLSQSKPAGITEIRSGLTPSMMSASLDFSVIAMKWVTCWRLYSWIFI